MIKNDNREIGFIYKNGQSIDKIYARGYKVFEQGFLRQQSGQYQITTDYETIGKDLVDYQIYGNSIQTGTPSIANPVEIQSVGDKTSNRFYASSLSIPEGVTVIYNPANYTYTVNGTVAQSNIWLSTAFVPSIPENTQVKLTVEMLSGSVDRKSSAIFYSIFNETNNEYLRDPYDYLVNPGKIEYTAGMISGTTMRFCIQALSPDGVVFDNAVYRIKLEVLSESVSTFEPYGYRIPIELTNGSTTNLYLDQPLRRVGSYADYVDYKNKKVYRNVIVNDSTGTKPIEESYSGTTDSTGTTIYPPSVPTLNNSESTVTVQTAVSPSAFDISYRSKAGYIGETVDNLTSSDNDTVDSDVSPEIPIGDNDIDYVDLGDRDTVLPDVNLNEDSPLTDGGDNQTEGYGEIF